MYYYFCGCICHKKGLCFNNKTSFETAAVKFAYNDAAYSRSKVVTTTRQRALQPSHNLVSAISSVVISELDCTNLVFGLWVSFLICNNQNTIFSGYS